jgi:hypothetical protein
MEMLLESFDRCDTAGPPRLHCLGQADRKERVLQQHRRVTWRKEEKEKEKRWI